MITLKFKTVTPLHISNGVELAYKLDYVIKWNIFCRFNNIFLSKILAEKNIIDFSRKYSLNDITSSILTEDIYADFTKSDFLYCVKIITRFYESLNNEDAQGLHFVKEFINSNGKFYVPASSVKGALLTALNEKSLGISNDSKPANIKDKVVLNDSDILDNDNFCVYLTNERPPAINLMCLKPDTEFDINVLQSGKLNFNNLKNYLTDYSNTQINNAKKELDSLSTSEITYIKSGADFYLDALNALSETKLENNEYLINLGFGGGSWYKIEKGKIPMFESKDPMKEGQLEPAHTTFTFTMREKIHHIGWCKLKIIEN